MDAVPPSSGNPYSFIMDPAKPPKRPLLGKLSGRSFIMKLVLIVGGAVLLMIVAAMVVRVFFGSKDNLSDIVALTHDEAQIVLTAQKASQATGQAVKSAAANTGVTVASQQQQWQTFLTQHGQKVNTKDSASLGASLAKQLTDAEQTSTLDATLTTVMRAQLQAYGTALQTARQHAAKTAERALLTSHYNEVQLLLKQWPEAQTPATSP